MKELIMDWSSHGNDRAVFPDGTYKVEVTNWEQVESKKGTPQIRWYGKVVASGDPQYMDKTIVEHTALTEAALWRVAKFVEAYQVDTSDLPKMTVGSIAFNKVLDTVIGRTAYWNVTYDEQYDNNKVEDYLPDDDIESISLDEKEEVDDDSPFE